MAERRARRRIPGRDRQQDTGAGLLLGQIVICAAAVAVALGLSTANPMQAAAVSPKIQLLMTAEKVTLPEQAVIAAKEQGGCFGTAPVKPFLDGSNYCCATTGIPLLYRRQLERS